MRDERNALNVPASTGREATSPREISNEIAPATV
jgi:hypothetical protein